MHTCELVEMAALLATHVKVIVHDVESLPLHAVESYWSASKCRQDRWSRALKNLSADNFKPTDVSDPTNWRVLRPMLEEILTSEVLTRVWSGVVSAHDRLRGTHEAEPVAHSILVGHLEARNRALNIMVRGRDCAVEEAVSLNRLRRRSERWTDLLLGQLVDETDVTQFAFDMNRVNDFASDSGFEQRDGMAWQLLLTSLRAAFQKGVCEVAPNADLNRRIAESILGCLPTDLFDSTGLFKSLWLSRLYSTTDETQGMIDEYLALDQSDFRISTRADMARRRF